MTPRVSHSVNGVAIGISFDYSKTKKISDYITLAELIKIAAEKFPDRDLDQIRIFPNGEDRITIFRYSSP